MPKLQTTLFLALLIHAAIGAAQSIDEATGNEFREVYRKWESLREQFQKVSDDTREAFDSPKRRAAIAEFPKLKHQLLELRPKVVAAAKASWLSDPGRFPEAGQSLFGFANMAYTSHAPQEASEILDALLSHETFLNEPDRKTLLRLSVLDEFQLNHFDRAVERFRSLEKLGPPDEPMARLADTAREYQALWKEEQEIRRGDAAAGHSSLVKLHTTQGDIFVELFADDAPNATQFFQNMVEKGLLNGLLLKGFQVTVQRVNAGVAAEIGIPNGDHAFDFHVANIGAVSRRQHFRGSLSLGAGGPNPGRPQLLLLPVPMKELNGKNMVFGRVVEGIEVLDACIRPRVADDGKLTEFKIVSATIIDK